ncbi:MAG: hypothetical protein Pg6A_00610 [Termitinemataceae bacterium]|nr:MAG: hypothetical protein Pg6A_00610 [Termitinemataceae bacterium]
MGNKKRMARICWNTNNWEKPSGSYGKSTNENTFEYQNDFGYEEWLFDVNKQNDGWQYGFLQPVLKGWEKHQGNVYDILLYTREKKSQKWYVVGWLYNVQVLSCAERCAEIKKHDEKGGIASDKADLKKVGAASKILTQDLLYKNEVDGFNIRFRPNGRKPERAAFREFKLYCARYLLLYYEDSKYKMENVPVFSI